MKNTITKSIFNSLASLSLFSLVLVGCESPEEVQPNNLSATNQLDQKTAKTTIHYGPTTSLWGGTARVWVETVKGKPIAMGIELSEEALENLPHEGMEEEFVLRLPGQVHATGIKPVTVGWNPHGHEPAGVYNVPHFDFHFYMITEGQIKQIKGGIDAGAYDLIARGVFPNVYTFGPAPFAVPHMGLHWSDITSPEFSPAGFSKTFIYGSNKDRVTFLEPMITLAYLESLAVNTSVETNIPALLKHEDPGYYPGSYTITRTADSYIIALTDLAFRKR